MDAEREVAAMQFGRNLQRYRRRAGLTQARLSYLTVVHRTEISLLERGRREPRLGTIVKLASALRVSLNMLLEGTGWTIERPSADDS
jgi:XRE family transcriptional regulator, fatty acid utilization regulator